MGASGLYVLAESTVATTFSILLIAFVRRPLAWIAGPQIAYWVWLLVPASNIVGLLPAPSRPLELASQTLPATISAVSPIAAFSVSASSETSGYAVAGLSVWFLGALLMLMFVSYRQRKFVRSLGETAPAQDGTYRSSAVRAPALVGMWKPRIVLPADFETKYDPDERALVIAHERAHERRLDIPLNVVATIWLCFSWFNPLMYWAVARFRSDQELACDATVLAEPGATRRRYGDALLKAQLAADSIFTLPTGCQWQSSHPLKERIVLIGRPQPSRVRRLCGALAASTLIVLGSFAVWATRPATSYAAADSIPGLAEGWGVIRSDRWKEQCDGGVDFSGSVVVLLAGSFTAHADFAAYTITHRDDGSMLLEGTVRISFKKPGGLLVNGSLPETDGPLTTDRATVAQVERAGGTVTRILMESAHISRPDYPLWLLPCECDTRCRVFGRLE